MPNRFGPPAAAFARALHALFTAPLPNPRYYASIARDCWRRATTLERTLVTFALILAALSVWDFVWVMTAPRLYSFAFVFNTAVGVLAYSPWAYLLCRHVAEAGRVRRELTNARLEYSDLLVRNLKQALMPSVLTGSTSGVCVVRVGENAYRFEYIDGEWKNG